MKMSVFAAIVSGVALGVIVLGAIIFGTSVTLAQGGTSRTQSPVAASPQPAPPASASAGVVDIQPADASDSGEGSLTPPAAPAGPTTGTLQLIYMGGQPTVTYNVGAGESCAGKTIMNYNLPNDGSESEMQLSNDDGSCAMSAGFGINDRLQACLGRSASVFEVRVYGAVVQSLTYTVTGPATGCEEFN